MLVAGGIISRSIGSSALLPPRRAVLSERGCLMSAGLFSDWQDVSVDCDKRGGVEKAVLCRLYSRAARQKTLVIRLRILFTVMSGMVLDDKAEFRLTWQNLSSIVAVGWYQRGHSAARTQTLSPERQESLWSLPRGLAGAQYSSTW